MKTKLALIAICHLLCAICFSAHAQGTAFTYQGRLNDGGNPAHGTYDFRFKLFEDPFGNAQTGSTVLTNDISTTNGLFTVAIDFGAGIFNGSNYWLEVDVRTNGAGSYINLNPLQAVTPAPYAIFANTASNVTGTVSVGQLSGSISSANLSGAYGNAVTFNNSGDSFSGNGSGLMNVNAITLAGLGPDQFWKTAGNSNTIAGVSFLGTADNQPLELRVNATRALRVEPGGTNGPNVIWGHPANSVTAGVVGATIGGGGGASVTSGALLTNRVTDAHAVVAGGLGNVAGNDNADPTDARYATVGGGVQNTAGSFSATIAGGYQNTASGYASTIAGGYQNTSGPLATYGTIGGGAFHSVIGPYGTIGGGYENTLGTNTSYATIGGGGFHSIGMNCNSTTISGGYQNIIHDNTFDAAIGGGSYNSVGTNSYYSAIGGGRINSIGDNVTSSIIAGGQQNAIQSAATYAAIGGGFENIVRGGGYHVIGGGYLNLAGPSGIYATNSSYGSVGGGYGNNAEGNYGTAPGGYLNWALGQYSFAAGCRAKATNDGAFVWADSQNADFNSTTTNQFSVRANGGVVFVTSGAGMTLDGQAVATANSLTALNAASITSGTLADARLSGNVAFLNTSPTFAGDITMSGGASYHHLALGGGNSTGFLYGSFPKYGDGIHLGYNYYADATGLNHLINPGGGTSRISVGYDSIVLATGDTGVQPNYQNVVVSGTTTTVNGTLTVSGTFNNFSDRNAKQDFTPVSPSQILDEVLRLPVSGWSYKTDAPTRHIGPMAQDFYSVFNIGTDDKHIAPIDEGGVALAAIQGLNQKLEEKNSEIQDLKQQNDSLAKRLNELETTVKSLAEKSGR